MISLKTFLDKRLRKRTGGESLSSFKFGFGFVTSVGVIKDITNLKVNCEAKNGPKDSGKKLPTDA